MFALIFVPFCRFSLTSGLPGCIDQKLYLKLAHLGCRLLHEPSKLLSGTEKSSLAISIADLNVELFYWSSYLLTSWFASQFYGFKNKMYFYWFVAPTNHKCGAYRMITHQLLNVKASLNLINILLTLIGKSWKKSNRRTVGAPTVTSKGSFWIFFKSHVSELNGYAFPFSSKILTESLFITHLIVFC